MLLTPHTAVGIAIGAAIHNPVVAIPLAFLSHFGLDLIPHWDDVGLDELKHLGHLPRRPRRASPGASRTFRIILLDALISLSLLLYFLYWAMPDYGVGITIFASAFAANLPDLFYVPIAFWRKRWGWAVWITKLQVKIQERSRAPMIWGLALQAVLILVCSLIARQEILIRLPKTWQIL